MCTYYIHRGLPWSPRDIDFLSVLLLRTAKGYAFAQVLFLQILLCKANYQNLSQSLSSLCTHHRCAYQKNLVNVVGRMHIRSRLLIWSKFGVKISDLPLLIPKFCSQAPLDTCKVTHYFKYIRRTDFFSLLKYSVIVPKSRLEVIMQSP
jgi:hypothetical protein